ncbi:MAG: squalene synthase HpnC [Planctomycetaceae bacterium]
MEGAYDFQKELETWGPESVTSPSLNLHDSETYCRWLARTHYENFPVVTWCLPKKFHQDFYNVYAYCRWADDLGDEVEDSAHSLELLDWWNENLNSCYAGEGSTHPVFVALKKTIVKCAIPQKPFADLISAFKQDQRISEYESFEQLLDYCTRSANPVGRLVLYVCGQFSEVNATWSDKICTGLQLTNFWQDVARDLERGRIYLPQEDCLNFGYSRAELHQRVTNNAFLNLMEFQVNRAREFLLAGLSLVARLPGRLQIDIELFSRGGLRILDRIESIGYRVLESRPVLRKRDMIWLVASCLFRFAGRKLGLG